ncbi:MAG: hypothetical protein ACRETA_05745 [Gammaproteobacteria bacterium]
MLAILASTQLAVPMDLFNLNLWNPAVGLGPGIALVTAFFLGLIHGITPDEHTWPITFSYSVGSYSSRGGMRTGLLFSLAFTVQRAIASEIAYFALSWLIPSGHWNYVIYIVVGAVMLVSGWYAVHHHRLLHLFHTHNLDKSEEPRALPSYMPLVHGFIAGWGTGAFALIVYTVLAPAMPSAYVGFLPGLLFGLGTMVMQILFGALVGAWMARRRMADSARAWVARTVAGRTLFWGGIAFILLGLAGIVFPGLGDIGIDTGIRVHNLAHVDAGFLLAVLVPIGAGGYAMIRSLREVRTRFD